MTTSRQPWTLDGNNIKSASGTLIGVFVDGRDAELVISWQDLNTELESAKDKLTEIENVLKGEY